MGILKQKKKAIGQKSAEPGASPINGQVPPAEHRFKPGNPGGPGRGPSRPFREALDAALKGGNLSEVTQSLVHQAKKGNVHAIKEIAERLDGKVDQQHKITGGDEPLVIHHIVGFGDDA